MLVKLLPLDEIKVDWSNNPRQDMDDATIDELAKSIVAVREMSGTQKTLLQPITVRPLPKKEGKLKYELRLGYRRYEALRRLYERNPKENSWAFRPEALIDDHPEEDEVDHASQVFALVENVQRESMTAIDEAKAIAAMIKEHGLKQQDVSRLLGKSKGWVSQRMKLLTTAAAVQEALGDGSIGQAAGRQLSRLKTKKAQKELLELGLLEEWKEEAWKEAVDAVLKDEFDVKAALEAARSQKEKGEDPKETQDDEGQEEAPPTNGAAPKNNGTFGQGNWEFARKPQAVKQVAEDLEFEKEEEDDYARGALDALLWAMGIREEPPRTNKD